jgi:Ca-activated chloride channel family protein
MRFLAANRLWLLVLVAALLVGYLVVQRQRRQYAVRFTNVDLLASVAPRHPGWRRHVTAAGTLLALTLVVMAFARPARTIEVPRETATVVLALDVSNSMKATDVDPTRLRAAQRAIDTFVDTLPRRFRLGLVTFANSAVVAVPPTALPHQESRRTCQADPTAAAWHLASRHLRQRAARARAQMQQENRR